MKDGPVVPVSPRQVSAIGLLLGGGFVFALGLFAVGPGHLYRGDTWPDYLTILAASLIVFAGLVALAARDAAGAWSWRRLRRRAFIGCGVSFVLLIVMSAIVPVEAGVWAVGDSAQGFSMFAFLESVGVAIVAAVKTPRRRADPFFTGDPAAAYGMGGFGTTRIPLRRYRFLSRESYVDVHPTGVTLAVPRVFGGTQQWFVPMSAVAVVLPEPLGTTGDEPDPAEDEPWVTREEFRTPYLSTTSPYAGPNLTLLFTVRQRIPPIRWFAGRDLDISALATRSEAGYLVDGVELRVVDPDFARRALLARGAQGVSDEDAFVQRHRDVVRDPEQVRAVTADARRSFILMVVSGVATVGFFILFQVTDDDRYVIGLGAVLVLGWLLEWVSARRRRP